MDQSTKKNRRKGEGSIYQRKDGRWAASVSVGVNPLTGKPKRKVLYADSEKEILAALKAFNRDFEKLDFTKDELTLNQWMNFWLNEYKKNKVKPRSFQRYYGLYKNYIEQSYVASLKLNIIKSPELQIFFNSVKATPNTLKYIYTLLKSCMEDAYKQDYVVKNPCLAVVLPKIPKTHKQKYLNSTEYKAAIKYLVENIKKGHNLLLLFDLLTGLREGEILGLEWSDVDLEEKSVYVNKTYSRQAIYNESNKVTGYVKTLGSTKNDEVRYMPLPDILIEPLKELRIKFQEKKAKKPNRYKKLELVFADPDGSFLDDKIPLRSAKKLYKEIGASSDLVFHSLRHTYATQLYENNNDMKIIQSLLGHTDINTTQKTYVHVTDKKKREAVAQINSSLSMF